MSLFILDDLSWGTISHSWSTKGHPEYVCKNPKWPPKFKMATKNTIIPDMHLITHKYVPAKHKLPFFWTRFSQRFYHPNPILFEISLGATHIFGPNPRWPPKSKMGAKNTIIKDIQHIYLVLSTFLKWNRHLRPKPFKINQRPPRILHKIQDGGQNPKWPPKNHNY